MPWYKVTKTIKGRRYLYWQRTYRAGRSVKTENRYIGPASESISSAPINTAVPGQQDLRTIPLPDHIAAMEKLDPFHGLDAKWRKKLQKIRAQERREDEKIQYLKLRDRIARQKAATNKAKRATKGIKALNPFIAKLLLRK